MTFTIGIDMRGYARKPQKAEIAGISMRVAQNMQERELEELADMIGNKGHAFLPALMNGGRKRENFQSMQWFVLDFDEGACFNEIFHRSAENGLDISFAYHTFSSDEKKERFRIVYIHEVPVADRQTAEMMLDMMLRVFPEADGSCRDVSRMFFGGKGIIYMDVKARFDLVDLKNAFIRAADAGENLRRNIKAFAKKHGVQVTNGQLVMGRLSDSALFDGKWFSSNTIYIGENRNPSFFVVRYSSLQPVKTCLPKKQQIDIKCAEGCRLLCDFAEGRELGHDAKFALATNFQYLHGGKKFFLEKIGDTYGAEKYEKWKRDYKYMRGYMPKKCSPDFCMYYESCDHAGTILETLLLDRKIRRIGEMHFYSLEEAYQTLLDNLQAAFSSECAGMHLIRAQTAMGKTRAYAELVRRNQNARFLIACPTNKLKEEVACTLKSMDEKCFVTPSIQGNPMVSDETADLISAYHESGMHNMGRKVLKEYLEEIPEECTAQREEIQRIIKGLDGIRDERIIVTTHAFLLQMPEDFLKRHTVIIDEDILQLQIFAGICEVSITALERAAQSNVRGIADLAEEVMRTPAGEYRKIKAHPYGRRFTEEELENMGAAGEGNLNDLLSAGSYVRQIKDGRESVIYFCPRKLPGQKYILLSATLNEGIYQAYFRDVMPVIPYPEKKAAYKGRLKQYTYHSLGRKDLQKKMDVFAAAERCLNQKNPQLITFKVLGRRNDYDIHFGNSAGTNALEGKDIAIIGTPYKNEESYKLAACYLGADVNQQQDAAPKRRRVQYKGYEFLITTYKQELLREVQLYSIESELEQCIGRARLLRQDCTVYLFSAFPCEQAEISIRDYLKTDVSD